MAVERKEGVKVNETGNKEWGKDYGKGDMEAVYRRGDWQSWDQIINWLEESGESDNELTPGEVVAMKEDISKLRQQGEDFIEDPDEAFAMAHKNRE